MHIALYAYKQKNFIRLKHLIDNITIENGNKQQNHKFVNKMEKCLKKQTIKIKFFPEMKNGFMDFYKEFFFELTKLTNRKK